MLVYRVCKTCLKELPIDQFPWGTVGLYRRYVCKPCYSTDQAKKVMDRYWRDPDKVRKLRKQQRAHRREHGLPEQRHSRPEDYPIRKKAYYQSYRLKVRKQTFEAYGGAFCACCGETVERFLSLDHIGNNGNVHRKEDKKNAGMSLYQRLKKQGYPPGYQVLCFNCNIGRAHNGGTCPHKDAA